MIALPPWGGFFFCVRRPSSPLDRLLRISAGGVVSFRKVEPPPLPVGSLGACDPSFFRSCFFARTDRRGSFPRRVFLIETNLSSGFYVLCFFFRDAPFLSPTLPHDFPLASAEL